MFKIFYDYIKNRSVFTEKSTPTVDQIFEEKKKEEQKEEQKIGRIEGRLVDEEEFLLIQEQEENLEELSLRMQRFRTDNKIEIWVPNDELVSKYEKLEENISKIRSLLHKTKEHRNRISCRQEQIDNLCNKKSPEEMNMYDKVQMIDLKKDIANEETKLISLEKQIEAVQSFANDEIINQYVEYMSKAKDYIIMTNLEEDITVDNILTSKSIYFKIKVIMDTIYLSASGSKSYEKNVKLLQKFAVLFNMDKIYYESFGKNIKINEKYDFFLTDYSKDKNIRDNNNEIKKIHDIFTQVSQLKIENQ